MRKDIKKSKERLRKMNKENRKVKCIYCNNPIYIDKFGGINKKGMFCNNILCLIKLIEESEKEKNE